MLVFSYNNIETLKGLENFTRLQELILDNNKLEDNIRFPFMPYLKTLSLNNNKVCISLNMHNALSSTLSK